MKLYKIFAVVMAAVFLSSCGGGVKNNDVLGRVPGYYMEISQLGKDFREWARGNRDPLKMREKMDKVKEEQLKIAEKAVDEARGLLDKEIPFTGANANPSFEVVNVVIKGYNGKGCFTAQAYVKAARDMELVSYSMQVKSASQMPLIDTYLYYVLLTEDNRGIALGKINPFSDRPAFGGSYSNAFEFSPGNIVNEGENTNQMGSPIAINCEMYDMTDFASIKFITANDYRNLGGR